jgi:hypothetical protein
MNTKTREAYELVAAFSCCFSSFLALSFESFSVKPEVLDPGEAFEIRIEAPGKILPV